MEGGEKEDSKFTEISLKHNPKIVSRSNDLLVTNQSERCSDRWVKDVVTPLKLYMALEALNHLHRLLNCDP